MTPLPRFVHWALRHSVPAFEREFVVGDLAEEFAARGRSTTATIWLACQTLGWIAAGGGRRMGDTLQDVRYGMRLLVKEPSFSVVAVLTLALGIGVSTALFGVIDAALIRTLPYPHPEELVRLYVEVPYPGRLSRLVPSMADVRHWRVTSGVFSHVGVGWVEWPFDPSIVEAGDPERLKVGLASEDLLEVFGIAPVLGRTFTAEDTRDGAPSVALVGDAYWKNRLGGTPDVIGRVVRIADQPVTIVGVVPTGFYDDTAFWQPERFTPLWETRRGTGTPVYGRLRPGISVQQAAEALTNVTRAANLADRGATAKDVVVTSLYDFETRGYSGTLWILGYAVAFIVLIACVNVAGLLLARGAMRETEMAVRASIGAARGRLVRQLMTESLVLAMAGGLLGVLLASLSLDALVSLVPLRLPRNSAAVINVRVLGVATVVSIASAVFFGLAPAIKLSNIRVGPCLVTAGRRHGPALARRRGQVLVAVEVALAVVLLAGAGLMIRSFDRLLDVGVGFDADSVLTLEVEPLDPSPSVREQYYTDLLERLRGAPEIAVAGALDATSFDGGTSSYGAKAGATVAQLAVRRIRPGFFEALGVSATRGRLPTEADRTSPEPVVVINETAAKVFFPRGSAVGGMLETTTPGDPPRRVIGVVGDIRFNGPQRQTGAESFGVAARDPSAAMTIVMRLRPRASVADVPLRHMAQSVGPKAIIGKIRTGDEWFEATTKTERHRTLLLGLLGGFGLLLTLVGIFSMTAYAVARRTQEIGVRMALGATPAAVVRAIVRDTAWPLAIGVAVGLVGAYVSSAMVKSFLFQTPPHDPGTFLAVATAMILTATIAAWVPARRASRIDPNEALRQA
jgi:putative ABC transport system permease protein